MSDEIIRELKQLLAEHRTTDITRLVDNVDTFSSIREDPWDVIPLFTENLAFKKDQDAQFSQFCEEMLLKICDHLEPDDVLLILIKEIEVIPPDSTVLILLKPLLKALLSVLCTKKVNYLAWCLNSIQVYVDELPVPENLNLEEEEKLMMDSDPIVSRISNLYMDISPFYDVVHEKVKSVSSTELKIILLRSYIQLLGKPLVFLDMELEKSLKSKARIAAERIVLKIIDLDRNIFGFVEDDFIKDHDDVRIRLLSLGTLFYLCFGENFLFCELPCVYDWVYVFQNCLKFIVKLLEFENQFAIAKGLKLARILLERTSGKIFTYQLLDSENHCRFCKNLTTIIIYSPMENYRKISLNIFRDYVFRFDSRGRYLLIYNIRKTINNTSLNAFITTQYKEMLVEQFDKETSISEYFKGTKLQNLLSTFCHLGQGIETDLMKEADQIIAALNLLRYLALRDKSNVTEVWDCIKSLDDRFLMPLKTALALSRAHYQLKLKEITDENAHGDKCDFDSAVSVSIGGRSLPGLTTSEKVKVINSSITAFDVIESLLCRVNECLKL